MTRRRAVTLVERPVARRRRLALLASGVAVVALGVGARPALAGGPTSPNGPAPVDINYIYSLIDNTNVSTDLSDGKSWLVRYYSRLSGAAGDSPLDNPNPCQLNATTGKNSDALLGNNGSQIGPPGGTPVSNQDCWWEMMGAWKSAAASQPGMTSANVTDHVYHLGEVCLVSAHSARPRRGMSQDIVPTTNCGGVAWAWNATWLRRCCWKG